MFNEYSLKNYNFRLIIYILALNIIGVFIISSATNHDTIFINKQILGIFLGIISMFFISIIPYYKFNNLIIFIYSLCIIILLLVIKIGKSPVGAGAKRWLVLPGIGQIQPSEFVKIGLIVCIAWLLSKYKDIINDFKFLLAFAAIAGIPLLLIIIEPDLSTTIVSFIVIISMLYIAGLSYKWILAGFAILIPFVATFIFLLQMEIIPFLRGYQARRILAWVNPAKYADANMQQANSIMAIGSGQLLGKGLNANTVASVKNGNFLVEEQTDFIFAVIGEELGFLGCIIVIFLFALIVFECLNLAYKAKDLQGRLICTGFAALIAFQSFTNIAVATGLFPNTGLPLPFISYGVSSLFSLYIGTGLVLNIGLHRKKRPN